MKGVIKWKDGRSDNCAGCVSIINGVCSHGSSQFCKNKDCIYWDDSDKATLRFLEGCK